LPGAGIGEPGRLAEELRAAVVADTVGTSLTASPSG
jgi:hypothetical protein